MTRQEEENTPTTAPAASRAAPPPVIAYSTPLHDRQLQSTAGQISILLGVIAAMILAAAFALAVLFLIDTGIIWLISFLVILLCGTVCGVVGACQRKHKKTTAIIGLAINSLCIVLLLLLFVI